MKALLIHTKWPSWRYAILGASLLLGVVAGQSSAAPMIEPLVRGWERHFKIDWQMWERRGRPVLSGYVINDAGFTAMKVQLLVEELDGADQIVDQRVTWLGSALTPGTRAYFEVPAQGAGSSKYRVSIFAFDWVQSAQLEAP